MYLFIILTVISLIITLLYYFGIIRYFQMHFSSTEKYLENYKNLDKASDKSKVIISFSTTPEKIKKLKPMLNSLLDQTVRVDNIVLNLPKTQEYDIPDEYKNVLNIFQCGQDYGCATKFIPTILREENSNTIIIMVEDNYVYGQDFIESLVESYDNNKNAILSNKAILVVPEFFDMNVFKRDIQKLDDNWIQSCINCKKTDMNYSENYKSFSI
jgi:hypothetical protein